MKTAVKKNTTDPIFNEVLKVRVKVEAQLGDAGLRSIRWISCLLSPQYPVERHLLFGKRLQVTVWHSGTLRRKVFLGQVLIPLDGWRLEDDSAECFNWYPLCPQVTELDALSF